MTDKELKYEPVAHEHEAFLEKALKRKGFREKYEELGEEYSLIRQMIEARTKSGLTQEAVAQSMGSFPGESQKVCKRRRLPAGDQTGGATAQRARAILNTNPYRLMLRSIGAGKKLRVRFSNLDITRGA